MDRATRTERYEHTTPRQRGNDARRRSPSGWPRRGLARTCAWILVLAAVLSSPAARADTPIPEAGIEDLGAIEAGAKDGAGLRDAALGRAVDRISRDLEPQSGVETDDDRTLVEIVHRLDPDSARTLVETSGGDIVGQVDGVTLAWVPADELVALEDSDGVTMVRLPVPIDQQPQSPSTLVPAPFAPAIAGGHVDVTNAGDWHTAGITGAGVKVGIIDYFDSDLWSAAQSVGDLPAPTGMFSSWNGIVSTAFPDRDSYHGVAVAEVVHDMAPGAQLFIASARTVTDLAVVIDYFDQMDVDIISRSLGSVYDGPGDGTRSAIDSVVDDAVARGMVWVNSAGNSAGRNGRPGQHWRGSFSDADGDGWIEFADGDEALEIQWATCFFGGFRWSDWDEADPTDYDLYFFEDAEAMASLTWEARLYGDQATGGLDPLESFTTEENGVNPCDTTGSTRDNDFLAIRLYDAGAGASGDVLQLTGPFLLDRWTNAYSATQPASDSDNPGAISAAAMEPLTGATIADYSSQGPTNDGRVKPDIAASVCIAGTAVALENRRCADGTVGFTGTSAAAPTIAGAAALVLDAGLAATPAQVKSYLTTEAVIDRGTPGVDALFGAGQLKLPVDAGGAPVWGASAELAATVGARSVTLSWPAATDPDGLGGYLLYRAPGTVVDGRYQGQVIADLDPGSRTFRATELTPDTRYAFWVEAYDRGGTRSTDGPLVVVTTITGFRDTTGHIFEHDVAWLAASRITAGCNPPENDLFCPDDVVTRGQMAAFIHRALPGFSAPGSAEFTDDDTSVFEADIEWLARTGITRGCNPPRNDRFCPDDAVTRGQMAAFLVRALGLPYVGGDAFFDDDASVFEADIEALAAAGITTGCGSQRFCPDDPVTRGQMAAFLRRALGG